MTPDLREPDLIPEPARLDMGAIGAALQAGWHDFRRAPAFGLLFSAFYVAGGLALAAVAFAAGQEWWLLPFVVGFPLLAPFAAVGLYEVSRRIEAGQPLVWSEVAGVIFRQKDRQFPVMALVILLLFFFWVIIAHTIWAVFMGASSMGRAPDLGAALATSGGVTMLLIGSAIGAVFAGLLFAITVVGLPLLLDRNVDFISAIIASFQAVLANLPVMAGWGIAIAALLAVGMAPLFLGLFVTLPILGHASWHMYRRLMPDDDLPPG